jgi:hypothetical protein
VGLHQACRGVVAWAFQRACFWRHSCVLQHMLKPAALTAHNSDTCCSLPCLLAGLAPAPVLAAGLLPSQTHALAAEAAAAAGAAHLLPMAVMMHEHGSP